MKKVIEKYLLNDTWTGIVFGIIFSLFLYFPGSIGLSSFYKYFDLKYLIGGSFLGFGFLLLQSIYKKENVKNFYLNKIWMCFIVWYFARDFVAFVSNYVLISQHNISIYYSISCGVRLFIFFMLLFFINLLFNTRYDKRYFCKTCLYLSIVFVGWIFIQKLCGCEICVKYDYFFAVSYILQTKTPVVLFLLIFFHLFIKKLNLVYFIFVSLVICFCSFTGKRSAFFLAVASFLCFFLFVLLPIIRALHKTKNNKFYLLSVLISLSFLSIFFYKIATWKSYTHTIFSDRYRLSSNYFNRFLHSDLFHQMIGQGDVFSFVGYPHNVALALLLSVGIFGLILWLWSFVYVLRLFLSFKEKSLTDFILWLILGIYFLNSFTTGFYIYHTPIYFVLYFMEYRYRHLGEMFNSKTNDQNPISI